MPLSSKKQPEKYRFVIDEDLGYNYFDVLRLSTDFEAILFSDVWEPGTIDPEWLPLSAEMGLIVITHDKRIRKQHQNVVLTTGAKVINTVGKRSYPEQASVFLQSWSTIERFLNKNAAPFYARFNTPTPQEENKKNKPKGKITRQLPK